MAAVPPAPVSLPYHLPIALIASVSATGWVTSSDHFLADALQQMHVPSEDVVTFDTVISISLSLALSIFSNSVQHHRPHPVPVEWPALTLGYGLTLSR